MLGLAYYCGRKYEQMAAHSRLMLEFYPEFPVGHWTLGWAALEMSKHDLAIAEFKLAVEYSGGATLLRALLAQALALAGHRHEAQQILQELLQNASHEYVMPYVIGQIHVALGQIDDAIRWLETGWQERAAWMPFLKTDPRMDVLRSEPRFVDLMG